MSDDASSDTPSAPTDGYAVADHEVELERVRLSMLAQARDPKTFALLDGVGIDEGWHCLEVGAGTGSVSAWMADRVGASGRVMSTDVDLRFHVPAPDNMIVREADIRTDRVPSGHFDLVHARAVLQHLPEREQVLDTLIDACKPGGWIVVEDGAMASFADQPLPEPYQTVHRIIASASQDAWRDPDFGVRALHLYRERGLVDLDLVGDVWAMRPGEPEGDWWFLALERALPRLVDAGIVTDDDAATALAQVREPGFVMMSTVSIAVLGRRPA